MNLNRAMGTTKYTKYTKGRETAGACPEQRRLHEPPQFEPRQGHRAFKAPFFVIFVYFVVNAGSV